MTKLALYDYDLPKDLVAQYPATERDDSRLLVVDRSTGALADRQFFNIVEYLRCGDVLVLNDSRVIHARLLGVKAKTGAQVELFLLKEEQDGEKVAVHEGQNCATWQVLARPARRLKVGSVLHFGDELTGEVLAKNADGSLRVGLSYFGVLSEVLKKVGHIPLPPYIERTDDSVDSQRYQTVYAKFDGSVAAPTAGLHFTEALLDELRSKGVEVCFVTLHVGLGTFRPVKSDELEEHLMHEEIYHISDVTAATIDRAKQRGRRVVCVGTTAVRALESAAREVVYADAGSDGGPTYQVRSGWASTDIFIYPGGRGFKIADALITNFHLPRSTLLMLVAAFYDREKILAAYEHAIDHGYRFFSYGDAMMIV